MHLFIVPFLLTIFLEFHIGTADYCSRKCKGKFSKSNCKETSYVQLGSCAYACVCDEEYSYYVEDTFKRCSSNKRCYQGDCLVEIPELCERTYGPDFIGLENPSNPCVYYCYSVDKPCLQYEEDKPTGTWCYTVESRHGQCLRGLCAAGELPHRIYDKSSVASKTATSAASDSATSAASDSATSTASDSATSAASDSASSTVSKSSSTSSSAESAAASSEATALTTDVKPVSGTAFSFQNTKNTGIFSGAGAMAGFFANNQAGTKPQPEKRTDITFLPKNNDGLRYTGGSTGAQFSFGGKTESASTAKPGLNYEFFEKTGSLDPYNLGFKRGINQTGESSLGLSTMPAAGWISNPFSGLLFGSTAGSSAFTNAKFEDKSLLGNQFGGNTAGIGSFTRIETAAASKEENGAGSGSFSKEENSAGPVPFEKPKAGTGLHSETENAKSEHASTYGSETGSFERSKINEGTFSGNSEAPNDFKKAEPGHGLLIYKGTNNDFISSYSVKEDKLRGNKKEGIELQKEKESNYKRRTGFYEGNAVNKGTPSGNSGTSNNYNEAEPGLSKHKGTNNDFFSSHRAEESELRGSDEHTGTFTKGNANEETFSGSSTNSGSFARSKSNTKSFSENIANARYNPRSTRTKSSSESNTNAETFSESDANLGSFTKSNANAATSSENTDNAEYYSENSGNAKIFSESITDEEYFSAGSAESDSFVEAEFEDESLVEVRNRGGPATYYKTKAGNFRETKADSESFSESRARGRSFEKSEFGSMSSSTKDHEIVREKNGSGRSRTGSVDKRLPLSDHKLKRRFYGSDESQQNSQNSRRSPKRYANDKSFRRERIEDFS